MKIKPKPNKAPYVCTADMAEKMFANGYQPLPAPRGVKGPRHAGWNNGSDRPVKVADVRERFKNHNGGAALLCGQLVAVDVDIDDLELCDKVCVEIERIIGTKTITRFGNWPRRTMFCRTAIPDLKKRIFKVDDTQQVEILANGCNCMAYGLHHQTKKPYEWQNGNPLNTPLEKLPVITVEQILAIGDYIASLAKPVLQKTKKSLDGRESRLRDLVYTCANHAIQKHGIDNVDAEIVAADAWVMFSKVADLSRPKGSNPNELYTFKDAFQKARYMLERFRNRNVENPTVTSSEQKTAFSKYKAFFEGHLSAARKDLISGCAFISKAGNFTNVTNMLDVLASYADEEKELSPSKLKSHLARYIEEMDSELLVDVPQWDGVNRVHQMASCLRVANLGPEHVEELLMDWGAKVFRRVDNPKNQNRVLMLQGKQGIGKDHWLNEMLDGLQHYYGQLTMERDEKESLIAVSEHIVMSIGEFERITQKSLGFFKHMVTSDQATVRKPYARGTSKHSMRCSFVATTNNKSILKDPTGNRRFIVLEIEKIDWSYPKGESLQVLAQFKQLAQSGYKASEEAEGALREYLALYTPEDPEKMAIELFDTDMLRRYRLDGTRELGFSEIGPLLERIGKQTGMGINAVSNVLKQNGRRKHTNTRQIYFCPDIPKTKPQIPLARVKGMKGKKQ